MTRTKARTIGQAGLDIRDRLAGHDGERHRVRTGERRETRRGAIEHLRLDREDENIWRREGALRRIERQPTARRQGDHVRRGRRIDERDARRRQAAREPPPQHRAAHLAGADEDQGIRPSGHEGAPSEPLSRVPSVDSYTMLKSRGESGRAQNAASHSTWSG